jgi:hypothetical protein
MTEAPSIRWIRVLGMAVLAEALPVVALIGVVELFGPRDAAAANTFAQETGRWFGPVAGAVAAFACAWIAGRKTQRPFANAFATGIVVAVIDFSLLVASPTPFEPLLALSALGRVAAGAAAGAVAGPAVVVPTPSS